MNRREAKSLTLGLIAAGLIAFSSISACSDDSSPETAQFVAYIGDVPTDLVSIDWILFDSAGVPLALGSVGPPLSSNQAVAQYRGIARTNMYMTIEPFLTGGTSCGVVQTPPFSATGSDQVFSVACAGGAAPLSALIVVGNQGPLMTASTLPFVDYGAPDVFGRHILYAAHVVDASLVNYSIDLYDVSGVRREWRLNTPTGIAANGLYAYDSALGTFSFQDLTGTVCATYAYDVTVGQLGDYPRVLTLRKISSGTCSMPAIPATDFGGIWISADAL